MPESKLGAGLALVRIQAQQAHPLRQALLRPHQTLDEVGFPGDGAPGAAHWAVRNGDRLVAVASLLPERPALGGAPGDWRVRGMATHPELRRRGLGAALIHACVEHAAARGGTALWCHARLAAVPFYRAQEFQELGEPFDEPEIGPHVLMWRAV